MSIGALNNALSGLKAAQQGLNVTSSNIANASTPGYTRKILPQEASLSDGVALGVKVGTIIREVDLTLIRDLINQQSTVEGLSVRAKYLDQIQAFHGASESEQSISSEISRLAETFQTLSSSPDNAFLINDTLNQAKQTATEINNFSNLIMQQRNDTQSELTLAVADANNALEIIARTNSLIAAQRANGESSAELEDQRDLAMRTLSKYLDIKFFENSDGKLTVMTQSGRTLADGSARELIFNATPLGPSSYYPGGGATGIFIDSQTGLDITSENLGGSIGALIELRDQTFPQYMAHIDELAQKLAVRFEAQGLSLFTDASGNVPPSVADPGLVGYVGFSQLIQVNPAIDIDPSLIRSGTTGLSVLEGSSEVVRKIVEFAFGEFAYEQATGTVDILTPGNVYTATGLSQNVTLRGDTNILAFSPLATHADINAGAQFSVDFGEGSGPQIITIGAGDTAANLVTQINTLNVGTPASLNGLGQLVFSSSADTTFADVSLSAAGFAALGHTFGTFTAQSPDFTVQVGIQQAVTIDIDPADTAAALLTKLNAIPNLSATLTGGGQLQLTPLNGGDITLVDGFQQPLAAMGITISSISHETFRQNNLGPDGSVGTDLISLRTLEEFGRNIVSLQSEQHASTVSKLDNEDSFFKSIERRVLDNSSVDLDQEVSELIKLQTAYTAAARMISASEELFDTLMDSIR